MSLAAGTRISQYEIVAPLGAGGMGEVYRARDIKLERDVAIKVLPEAVAQNPERLARFEREAKILASLNHPNIAQIYGVEGQALIMELVEGETLAGPLPIRIALDYARQIAGALEAAHEKGIVHRDLKPANIKITPQGIIKVLDFGLAAIVQNSDPVDLNASQSPTLTLGATQAGVLLGTAAYMSPEQARGRPVDKRADIWAFGVVLYEMVTGRRLFAGDDIATILAAVVLKDPELDAAPPEIQHVLKRCLEKDPKKRLRDISGVELLLDERPHSGFAPEKSTLRRFAWPALAAILALAVVALSISQWRGTRPVEHPLMRLNVDFGSDAIDDVNLTAAISPDGTRFVFRMRAPSGIPQLATQLLDQAMPTLLAGTENARGPFFSPDGDWIGFFADGKLKKISLRGGSPITLCDAPDPRGAAWSKEGYIVATLAGGVGGGLLRVPATGGAPQVLTSPATTGQATHRYPQILPGGEAVLFTGHTATANLYDDATIEVLSLKTGRSKVVHRGGYFGRYLPGGYLLYVHEGTLYGARFDLGRMEIRGNAVPLLDHVVAKAVGDAQFDFAQNGVFFYLSGKDPGDRWRVAWLDHAGGLQPLFSREGRYYTPRLSPDGKLLALTTGSYVSGDLQVYDWTRDTMTRLTFAGQNGRNPVWTPDGRHIVFQSRSPAGYSIQWIRADGGGQSHPLLESKYTITPYSFSPDGKRLAFTELDEVKHAVAIWTLPIDAQDPEQPSAGQQELFQTTPGAQEGLPGSLIGQLEPSFSPDGHWIAYTSRESGRFEVYVRPFPARGGKWQVSNGGGRYAIWSRRAAELYYQTLDRQIMVVPYTAKGPTFSAMKPVPWSDLRVLDPTGGGWNVDLAPGGDRFAVFPRTEGTSDPKNSPHVALLLNFFDELRRRIPDTK